MEASEEIQSLLDAAWERYQSNVDAVINAAADVLKRVEGRADETINVIREYTSMSAQLSNNYYDEVREIWKLAGVDMTDFEHTRLVDPDRALWQVQGGFNDTDFAGLTYQQVQEGRSLAGKTIDDLWPDITNLDTAQQLAAEMMNAAARLQTQRNMRRDPTRPRWARVPTGATTCAFCLMLASRGFAYTSEESAGREMQYHSDCDCKIIPSWGKQVLKGYDPDRFAEMYEAAKQAAGAGAGYRSVLAKLRRLHRGEVTDGVWENSKPWPEDVRRISEKTWLHILVGEPDKGLGGHAHYAKVPGKTHFPETWDDEKIKWAIRETIVAPDFYEKMRRPRVVQRLKTIDGVEVTVKLVKKKNSWKVNTAFPSSRERWYPDEVQPS
ncbi:EndoU domain-containing protein [Arcanobacterium haemolyticum]|nr:EndoU domain-containing protein [Arcanobacterium haemolyticum]